MCPRFLSPLHFQTMHCFGLPFYYSSFPSSLPLLCINHSTFANQKIISIQLFSKTVAIKLMSYQRPRGTRCLGGSKQWRWYSPGHPSQHITSPPIPHTMQDSILVSSSKTGMASSSLSSSPSPSESNSSSDSSFKFFLVLSVATVGVYSLNRTSHPSVSPNELQI